jgi:site-specific DNA recombinase
MIADEDAYKYLVENEVELFSDREAFDEKHGIMAYNRTLQRPGKATRENPKSEWIVSVGKHFGTIPGTKWVQAQKLLELNKSKNYRKPRSHVALLSGIIVCGKCGDYMRPKLSGRKTATGESVYTYLCTTKERSRGHVCDIKNANGNTLDAKIIETIKSFDKQSPDMAKQITQTKKRISGIREGYGAELSKLRLQIKDNEKDIKALVISLGKTEGTNAEKYIIEQIDEMHKNGDALKKRLSELEAIIKHRELDDIEFNIIRQRLSNMGESIDEYTVEQKRAAIRTFIRKIVWDGENAHLYLLCGDGDYEFPTPPDKNSGNKGNSDNNPD